MKRILMLGGSVYQVYVIKKAVQMGYYVISCDYLPDNPGHQYAHEYHNVSTTDKEAVLELATRLKVDGIVAYASDPAAPTAAYVCEKLGLPTSPYQSVEILSKKDLFREYLTKHGFNVPKAKGYTTFEEAEQDKNDFQLPVMIKPVDSSGSKGINNLTDWNDLQKYVADALSYSRDKRFLIEEFIDKKGAQISGDAFSVDGELKFYCFGNEFYSSALTKDFAPLGESFPSFESTENILKLVSDVQRLITLLGMKSNAYNVEAIVDKNDNVYILELGARSGGSLIPQITEYATGINMVEYVILAALGEDCSSIKLSPARGYWSNYMVNSKVSGVYESLEMTDNFRQNNFVDYVTDFKQGDKVNVFKDAADAIGTLIIKYNSKDEMSMIENMDDYVSVKLS